MKYKDWLNDWLELYVKPVVKTRTYEKNELLVRVHIIPALGELQLEELKTEILQRFVISLSERFSSSYVNAIISVLQKSLKAAVLLGKANGYYADKIIRPKIQEKKIECFSIAEQRKIEQAVINSRKSKLFGILLCLYMGLRVGELLALKWSDIDFKKQLLYVNRSCHYGKGENGQYGRIEETPKTRQSARVIPIPKQMLPYLKDAKKNSQCEYVVNSHGKPISVRSYQNSFEVLLRQLNIPHRGFHALRHTFATRALECGMDVKTLSEILGHKNSTVTLNRYCHSLMEHKTEMMNKLGKMCSLNERR